MSTSTDQFDFILRIQRMSNYNTCLLLVLRPPFMKSFSCDFQPATKTFSAHPFLISDTEGYNLLARFLLQEATLMEAL